MKNIRYILMALAAGVFILGGCSKDETGEGRGGGPVELKSITASVGKHDLTRAINPTNPTMSGMDSRANQSMRVAIGTTTYVNYVYSTEKGKWVPESGTGAIFSGFADENVTITIYDPYSESYQNGSAEALINADSLRYSASLPPSANLSGIVMTHAKTLIEVDLGTINMGEEDWVRIGRGTAYNIPSTNKWQAIVTAGKSSVDVIVIIGEVAYFVDINSSDVEGGEFMENCKYKASLSIKGTRLVVDALILSPWDEIDGGDGTGLTTLQLEGFTDYSSMKVTYADGTVLENVRPSDGKFHFSSNKAGGLIEKVELDGGAPILIGRKEDGTKISLRLDTSGDVMFRDAVDGYVPVGTVAELALLNTDNTSLAGSYRQEYDLNLLGKARTPLNWTPIGVIEGGVSEAPFTGVYDGGGYKIYDLYINRPGFPAVGLFGVSMGQGEEAQAVLNNIHIASGSVIGVNSPLIAGVCGGAINTIITDCSNAAEINNNINIADVGAFNAGGVCGFLYEGEISGCKNLGDINLNYSAINIAWESTIGGVCGYTFCMNANTSSNYGKITINATTDMDGIVACGGAFGAVLYADSCKNYGDITAGGNSGAPVGGIAGIGSTIINCENYGKVKGIADVGGICGYNDQYGILLANYNTAAVTGEKNVGGICGTNNKFVTACYNTAPVNGKENTGGISGFNNDTITACYNTGLVTGMTNTGGICGVNQTSVSSCFWAEVSGGATTGVAFNEAGATDSTLKFGAEYDAVAGTGWPSENTDEGGHADWAVYSGGSGYWVSLGYWDGIKPVYPELAKGIPAPPLNR